MEQGFVLDFANGHAARYVSHWAPGVPQSSFWSGLKIPDEGMFPIGTFRCTSCGYLESYAGPQFAAK